ncbi:MAG TPA: GNAT family N-acetyltransferase [Candidatus Marinimicrobia bacterium]|nr:GNAT family N-acetyltransferase [Candidatus Neomarinimicrobiota bacterium]
MIIAETQRIILREFELNDAPAMFPMDSDPKVLRFIGTPPFTELSQTETVIEFVRRQYLETGFGRLAVVLKATGTFLGWAGIKLERSPVNGHRDFYDLGYRFLREYWGYGYATEAARASLAYGFRNKGLTVINASVDAANGASIRILEKLGMSRLEEFIEDDCLQYWYEIRAEQFR